MASRLISNDPRNVASEPAFMRGYGDFATIGAVQCPYEDGSADAAEYFRGAAEAERDDDEVGRPATEAEATDVAGWSIEY